MNLTCGCLASLSLSENIDVRKNTRCIPVFKNIDDIESNIDVFASLPGGHFGRYHVGRIQPYAERDTTPEKDA